MFLFESVMELRSGSSWCLGRHLQEEAMMSSINDVRWGLHGQEMQALAGGDRVYSYLPAGFGRWQWLWLRVRTRRQLRGLTAIELRDIGLTREQAHTEGLKRFWQS
jgi:uncharacterized protein YjiS (DUF1127 family)